MYDPSTLSVEVKEINYTTNNISHAIKLYVSLLAE